MPRPLITLIRKHDITTGFSTDFILGEHAALLLHNGEILDDLSLLADPEANLALIMIGGEIIEAKF